jgi:hypothetical protein
MNGYPVVDTRWMEKTLLEIRDDAREARRHSFRWAAVRTVAQAVAVVVLVWRLT